MLLLHMRGAGIGLMPQRGSRDDGRVLRLLLVGLLILLVHMRGTGVDLEAAGAALGRKSRCAFCCSCLLSC